MRFLIFFIGKNFNIDQSRALNAANAPAMFVALFVVNQVGQVVVDMIGTHPIPMTLFRVFPSCRCLDRRVRRDRVGAVQVERAGTVITLNDRPVMKTCFATNHTENRGFP